MQVNIPGFIFKNNHLYKHFFNTKSSRYSLSGLNISFAADTPRNLEANKQGGCNVNKHSKL